MKKMLLAPLMIMLVACSGAAVEHLHWGYTGEAGPEQWAELDPAYEICGIGEEQSPIDLTDERPQDLANLEVNYQPSTINIFNNGHTIQVNYNEGSFMEVNGVQYNLLQFHFHVPSEHTVDGQHFPAELHLVHADAQGNLAVVGILLDEGAESAALGPVWANLPAEEGEVQTVEGNVNAAEFLPADQATYRYPGSLTTPPCSEGVSWFVMMTPAEVSTQQLDELRALINGSNRPVQELESRELIGDSSP